MTPQCISREFALVAILGADGEASLPGWRHVETAVAQRVEMPVAAAVVLGKKPGELIDGGLQLQRKAMAEQRRGNAQAARFRYEDGGNALVHV